MIKTLITSLLISGALTLHAAEKPATAGRPDITKLSVAEINKVQPPPDGLFPVPFHPGVPVPSSQIWGGMFLWWNDGTYYLIYDAANAARPLGLYLLTSKDGVYWKQEGAYFDKDNPNKLVCNPEIYKLKPDGPWVIAYEHDGSFSFATSYDMKQWTRLGPLNGYKSREQLRKDYPVYSSNFATPVSYPHPDGGWFHLVYAQNAEYVGMGYARSDDGIHYKILPPVRFDGVPCDRFCEKPLMTKGGETAGITRIGKKYFFSGGGRQGDWFLAADKPEGPYRPTPKNHTIPRDPENYWRIYNDVPDAPLITDSRWANDAEGKRQWMMTPLKRLVSDGESVWIKWWEGNEKLKAQPVALTLKPEQNGVAAVEPAIDPRKVTVIEGMIDFSPVKPEVDFTRNATASATMTHTFGPGSLATGAEDYLGVKHLIDELDERSWIGDLTGAYHATKSFSGMDDKQLAAFIAAKKTGAEATIDLGKVRPVGRIEARWTRCPGVPSVAMFKLDYIKGTKLAVSADGKAWQDVPVSYFDEHRLNYENLGLETRYLKFTFPPLNITADKLRNEQERKTFRVVGLAEVNIHEAGQHDITRAGGLPGILLGREGDADEAILFDPSGKVLMGEIRRGETAFRLRETRNIEVPFPAKAKFRLIVTDDQIEVYVNDYFIRCIETKSALTGGMGIIGHSAVSDAKAWAADPNYKEQSATTKQTKGTK
ncbi:MAG: hypothetical protein D4R65_00830 [Verrucomicrobiaceae bacterium]|nr:MAG: hypothetical protein D4R65_00830 [Verrucomicrobiaceae bacterium]